MYAPSSRALTFPVYCCHAIPVRESAMHPASRPIASTRSAFTHRPHLSADCHRRTPIDVHVRGPTTPSGVSPRIRWYQATPAFVRSP